ncbi:MAG: GNAT family N-acetyltransferase [Phycisphaerales bacterium]
MLNSRPCVVRIGRCTLAEAKPLLARHYAAGAPARVCCLLGAWMESERGGELVGVLAVSHPTLNDRWREIAWPGVFAIPDKRERAQKLNETVRRISRVVVLPRHRGRGIASALVDAYLRRPLTDRTEVVAAMGDLCRCFERAGMRAVECAPVERDVTLAAALKRLRIAPELLADERAVEKLSRDEEFVRAMRRWANAAGGTRKALRGSDAMQNLAPVAARAAMSIRAGARVWVSDGGGKCGMRISECGMKGETRSADLGARSELRDARVGSGKGTPRPCRTSPSAARDTVAKGAAESREVQAASSGSGRFDAAAGLVATAPALRLGSCGQRREFWEQSQQRRL